MDFCRGPVLTEFIEARGRKTPVAHAPDKMLGERRQAGQTLFDVVQRLPSRVAIGERDVLHKLIDRLARLANRGTGPDRPARLADRDDASG